MELQSLFPENVSAIDTMAVFIRIISSRVSSNDPTIQSTQVRCTFNTNQDPNECKIAYAGYKYDNAALPLPVLLLRYFLEAIVTKMNILYYFSDEHILSCSASIRTSDLIYKKNESDTA
jgi:hypothetical protein